ncbi:MAG: hypothetical protein ACRDNX_06870, partial [Gaiellaceae bacterium]
EQTATRRLTLANPHMLGDDVKEAQRLLTTNPYRDFQPGGVDGEFGSLTAGAVRRAKWELGYPKRLLNESFGAKLKMYLQGTPLPPEYRKERDKRLKEAGSEAAVRERIVEWAEWGVANEPQISYTQIGARLAGIGKAGLLPLDTDCSAFATLCYNWAGAPNPNAAGAYDPRATAYTGTMLTRCRHIDLKAVQPGDLVVWSPPATGQHVCVVVSTGSNPWLVSHGADRGPIRIRFSDQDAYQRANGHGTVTWLSAFA